MDKYDEPEDKMKYSDKAEIKVTDETTTKDGFDNSKNVELMLFQHSEYKKHVVSCPQSSSLGKNSFFIRQPPATTTN